jgi:hypothetical protein
MLSAGMPFGISRKKSEEKKQPAAHSVKSKRPAAHRRSSVAAKPPRTRDAYADIKGDGSAPETVSGSRLSRYGKPPFLSAREKRLRGITSRERSGAFEGIPLDIVEAFSPAYEDK